MAQFRRVRAALARAGGAGAGLFGPAASDGANMLREVHAPAFAELFRRACAQCE
jgi:hypothetical protein